MNSVTRNSWSDFWIRYGLPCIGMAVVGYWFAQKLSNVDDLLPFKVFNIIGLCFDLVGIICLSHFVMRDERLKHLVVGPIAEYLYLFLIVLPVGMMISVHLGASGPSTDIVKGITYSTFMYIMFAAVIYFGPLVISGDRLMSRDPEIRANWLGLFFLVGGVVIQIFAAFHDMYTK